ncbi:hypothetical protein ABFS82_10G092200 [Erythranthe guttata]
MRLMSGICESDHQPRRRRIHRCLLRLNILILQWKLLAKHSSEMVAKIDHPQLGPTEPSMYEPSLLRFSFLTLIKFCCKIFQFLCGLFSRMVWGCDRNYVCNFL